MDLWNIAMKMLSFAIWAANKIRHVFAIYMDFCNFALVGFMGWLICSQGLHWHNVPSILVGLVLGGLLHWAFKTRIGFWIISPIFSALWTWVFVEGVLIGLFKVDFTPFWYWVVILLCFGYNMSSHNFAIWREKLAADEEAARAAAYRD